MSMITDDPKDVPHVESFAFTADNLAKKYGIGREAQDDYAYRSMRRGLDAVPALIAHLTDDRITRAHGRGCGDNHRRVKGVVLEILADLRGGDYTQEGFPVPSNWRVNGNFTFAPDQTANPYQNGLALSAQNPTGFTYASFLTGLPNVLNLNAPSALLGFQLGGIVGHKFLSKYRVGIDLDRSVLRLKNVTQAG